MNERLRSDAPLGVFDSGLGGLTVVHALRRLLPNENLVYLGDTARVPYGTRSAETVVKYARGCARILVSRGVKALVIACNTVSAVALDVLRAELDLPVIGVVEPGAGAAVEAASRLESNGIEPLGRIGVLGTAGTIASGAYSRAVTKIDTRMEVVAQAAPLLVPLVEEGWLEGEVPELAVRRYVAPLIEQGARVLVLGCTHYPLLRSVIERVSHDIAGEPIPIIDGAVAKATAAARLIQSGHIEPRSQVEAPKVELYVTDLPASFKLVAQRFLGESLPQVAQIDI